MSINMSKYCWHKPFSSRIHYMHPQASEYIHCVEDIFCCVGAVIIEPRRLDAWMSCRKSNKFRLILTDELQFAHHAIRPTHWALWPMRAHFDTTMEIFHLSMGAALMRGSWKLVDDELKRIEGVNTDDKHQRQTMNARFETQFVCHS